MCDQCKYVLVGTDATTVSELAAANIVIKHKSTGGSLVIIDDHDNEIPTLSSYPALPGYVAESIDPKNMSVSEARTLQSYYATTNGGSDGYNYDWKS